MPARFAFDESKAQRLFNYLASGCGLRAALGQAEITPACFRHWMTSTRPVHVAFQIEVRKCRTAPLALAEMDVFNADKKTWLRYGPGGWLRKARGKAKADQETNKPIELRELPAWWEFRSALLRNLQNSPELRERFTAVLTELARAREEQAKREEAALVRPAGGGKKSE